MRNRVKSSLGRIADHRIIIPVICACIVFGGLPILMAVVLSFCSVDENSSFHFGSLDAYRAVFAGGRIAEFARIVTRAVTVTFLTMFLAIPASYWLANIKRRGLQTLVLALLVTPWLVSDMLRAFGWQLLLSPVGLVSAFASLLMHGALLDGLRYNFGAVVLGLVSAMLPVGIFSAFAAIPDRSRNEWLAATELGRPRHTFALMVFGRAKLGIILGAGLVFVLSCFASAEPRFLDGPTQSSIQTIAASLVNDSVTALLALGTLLVMFVLSACISAAIAHHFLAYPTKYSGRNRPSNSLRLGPYSSIKRMLKSALSRFLDTTVQLGPPLAGVVSVVICCAPLLIVGAEAFKQPGAAGMRWTLENFELMLSSPQLMRALANSLGVAVAVSVFSALLAFVLSLTLWDLTLRRWVLLILASLLLLPGDAYSISLIQLLKILSEAEGGWTLIITAQTLWAIPFATGTLLIANQHLSEHILEAGLEYASGPLAVIVRIIGRINGGRIAGVALLSGCLSLNEYLRSSYLGGGLLTVGNEVHGRLIAGLLPQNRGIFAAEILVFTVSIVTVIIMLAILRSRRTFVPHSP